MDGKDIASTPKTVTSIVSIPGASAAPVAAPRTERDTGASSWPFFSIFVRTSSSVNHRPLQFIFQSTELPQRTTREQKIILPKVY